MEKAPHFSINEIMKLLPHRFPFIMVDRVEEVVRPSKDTKVGYKIRATKNCCEKSLQQVPLKAQFGASIYKAFELPAAFCFAKIS